MAAAATCLSLVKPCSQISSNLLHKSHNLNNNNNNNHVSFSPNNNNLVVSLSSVPQPTPLLASGGGGGGRGGGGRGRFSSGAGGDGYYYGDDERMGHWESFLEGLRLGFSTPDRYLSRVAKPSLRPFLKESQGPIRSSSSQSPLPPPPRLYPHRLPPPPPPTDVRRRGVVDCGTDEICEGCWSWSCSCEGGLTRYVKKVVASRE